MPLKTRKTFRTSPDMDQDSLTLHGALKSIFDFWNIAQWCRFRSAHVLNRNNVQHWKQAPDATLHDRKAEKEFPKTTHLR